MYCNNNNQIFKWFFVTATRHQIGIIVQKKNNQFSDYF